MTIPVIRATTSGPVDKDEPIFPTHPVASVPLKPHIKLALQRTKMLPDLIANVTVEADGMIGGTGQRTLRSPLLRTPPPNRSPRQNPRKSLRRLPSLPNKHLSTIQDRRSTLVLQPTPCSHTTARSSVPQAQRMITPPSANAWKLK